MITVSQYWQWHFPGGTAGVAVLGIVLLALVFVSYRYTMREVRRRWKWLLIGCRVLFLALLAFGLCRPTAVTRKTEVSRNVPTVAVMIDESGSMRCRGYNGHTRLDEAGVFVRRLQERSRERCELKLFGFADKVRAVNDFAELQKAGAAESTTALFGTVTGTAERLWTENVKAVIWISDGVETAHGSKEEALAALAASNTPQLWVPATLKLPCRPSLAITHLECPGEVRPGALFGGLALIRKDGQLPDGKIVFTVKNGDREVAREELVARSAGPNSFTVKFNLSLPEEGIGKFKAELRSAGMNAPAVSWNVSAVPSLEQKILLYQGELTFDQAFLRRIFAGDKRAKLTVRFARDVLGSGNPGNRKLGSGFPDAKELAQYNVVILNALRRSQLTPRMEADLKNFLRQGGSLLFMTVNNEAAGQFSASGLEEILPVTFDSAAITTRHDEATDDFLRKMQNYRRADALRRRSDQPQLRRFEITADGKRSRIFTVHDEKGENSKTLEPKYQEFALVKKIKPGAILLAAAADFKSGGQSRPLLAVQNYGRGRSAAICSDSLWHWKLSLPSADTSYESFWQNLLLWLSAGNSSRPAWMLNSYVLPAGKPAELQFKLPPDGSLPVGRLTFEARREDGGKTISLAMNTASGRMLKGELKGEPGNGYILVAKKGNETVAEAKVSFAAPTSAKELDHLAPDVKTITELALATGAAVIDDDRKIDWDELLPPLETKKISTVNDPLWHRSWIFLLMLAAFVAELILRRVCKLV